MKRKNIRDSECCFNCAYGLYDSEDGTIWCVVNKDYLGSEWTEEKREWVRNNSFGDHSVCDSFEKVY